MPVLIQCLSCKRKLRVQDHLLGKNIKCPSCGTKFVAQAAEPAPAPPVSAPTPAAPEPIPTAITSTPVFAAPPPLPSAPAPGNEEPLEVLDPIVLDEPASSPSGKALTALAPPTPSSARREQAPVPVHDRLPARTPGSPMRVFALLTGLLIATIALGLFGGWWINRSIASAHQSLRSLQR